MTTQGESTRPAPLAEAAALIEVGQPAPAALLLEDHLVDHAQDADGWSLLARARLALDDNAGALAAGRSALAIDPNHVDALLNRSAAFLATNVADEAIAAARRAARLAPEDWRTHHAAGLALRRNGFRSAQAFAAAHRAVDLAPDHADPHALLGWLQARGRLVDEARVSYRAAREIDPKNESASAGLAALPVKRRRFDPGADAVRAAVTGDPRQDPIHRNVAAAIATILLRSINSLAVVFTAVSWLIFHFGFFSPTTTFSGPTIDPRSQTVGFSETVIQPDHAPLVLAILFAVLFAGAAIGIVTLNTVPLDGRARHQVWRILGGIAKRPKFGAFLLVGSVVNLLLLVVAMVTAAFSKSVSENALLAATAVAVVAVLGNLAVVRKNPTQPGQS